MNDPVMKKASGHGIEIQLAVWEGEGKTVLCVHGMTANCRCWDVAASALAPQHEILAMDLRGRGLSDKPSTGYSLQHHVQDIYFLMKGLDLERTILMGHSLGAFIALAFATRYPEHTEKLILMDGAGQLTQEQWDKVSLAVKPSFDRLGHLFPSFDAYVENMKKASFMQPWSPALETYFQYETEEVEGGLRSKVNPVHIGEEVQNLRQEEPARYYSQITCPVLILRATDGILSKDDLVLPETAAERMVAELPNARVVNITGTNHFSILFQPNEKRDKAIQEFL